MILKYLGALWKNSFLKQILTFTYSLPVMLVIFINLLQMILPCYSIYKFYDRSNFVYVYDMPIRLSETDKSYDLINEDEGVSFLCASMNLYSKYNKQETEQSSFYVNSFQENVFFTTRDKDLNSSYFTKDNFFGKKIIKEDNVLYTTYGTAKALDVKKGRLYCYKVYILFRI